MKKISMLTYLLLLYSAVALISGCGGGGGGSTPAQPTTAVVKLSTSGALPSGTLIAGIDITLILPSGVTVKSTNQQTDAGVVTESGVAGGSIPIGAYSAATSTLPGKVKVVLINAVGFGTGEFATVNCDIAAGTTPTPTAAGFSLANFSAIDAAHLSAINGLTPGLTADIR